MIDKYDNLLNSYYGESGKTYSEILSDPYSAYYSDVKNIVEGR
jgi:hypothetical protein